MICSLGNHGGRVTENTVPRVAARERWENWPRESGGDCAVVAHYRMPITRAARVATPRLEVRLGAEYGRLIDISATGALVRTDALLQVGREYPVLVNWESGPVRLTARVVRAQPMTDAQRGRHGEHTAQQMIGLQITALSASAKHVVRELC